MMHNIMERRIEHGIGKTLKIADLITTVPQLPGLETQKCFLNSFLVRYYQYAK